MLPLWIALPYLFGRWAKSTIKKQQADEYVRQHPPESLKAMYARHRQIERNDWCNFQESQGFSVATSFYRDENGNWQLKPKPDSNKSSSD